MPVGDAMTTNGHHICHSYHDRRFAVMVVSLGCRNMKANQIVLLSNCHGSLYVCLGKEAKIG